jgi:hypothetical protein
MYKSPDRREAWSNLNPAMLFCVRTDETILSTKGAKSQLEKTGMASLETGKAFKEQVGKSLQALLVYNVLSDLTLGQRSFIHYESRLDVKGENKDKGGSLGSDCCYSSSH